MYRIGTGRYLEMSNDDALVAGALAAWKTALDRADKFFTAQDAAGLEKRVAPDRNRLIYLWGHLSAMHDRMLSLLSVAERVHPEFDDIFIGTPDRTTEGPSVEVIHAWWAEVNTRLNVGMVRFSSSDWLAKHASVSEEDFAKEPLRNRFSILLSHTNHLSYHIGQAAIVR